MQIQPSYLVPQMPGKISIESFATIVYSINGIINPDLITLIKEIVKFIKYIFEIKQRKHINVRYKPI